MVAVMCSKLTLVMPSPLTINDIADFIVKVRIEKRAFGGWTYDQIRTHLMQHYSAKGLAVVRDEKTFEIVGVVTGDVDSANKRFHVQNILTVRDDGTSLRLLLNLFKATYPNYTLSARRKGKQKQYDTERLLARVSI